MLAAVAHRQDIRRDQGLVNPTMSHEHSRRRPKEDVGAPSIRVVLVGKVIGVLNVFRHLYRDRMAEDLFSTAGTIADRPARQDPEGSGVLERRVYDWRYVLHRVVVQSRE